MDVTQYEPGESLPGTVYRVVRHLATGGMGSVYDVEDITVGKRYVLKTLHPQLLDRQDLARRMEAEARTLAKLEHPNIVEVVTAGVTTGELKVPFYVMERLNGQNLRVVLDKKSALDLGHCYRIAIDVLDALEHAHDNAVIHRDVKPENIFLHRNPNGTTVTKLLDFGIMRLLDRKSSQTQGKFIGTLRYASPEQILGEELGPATDIYSLGVVLYEMICGRGPFDEAGDAYAIGAAHAQRPAPSMSRFVHVPPAVEALVMSALEKDPRARPRDCFAMANELRKLRRAEEAAPRVQTVATVLSVRDPSAEVAPPGHAQAGQASHGASAVLAETAFAPETEKMGAGPVVSTRTVVMEGLQGPAPKDPAPSPQQLQLATQRLVEGSGERGIDRSAVTHASAPFGTTRRLAVHGTLMDDALSPVTGDDLVRRAFDDPQPLAVPSTTGSNPGDIVFPQLRAAPSTTGDGLLVGGPRPSEKKNLAVPLVVALTVGIAAAGFVAVRFLSASASAERTKEEAVTVAPGPVDKDLPRTGQDVGHASAPSDQAAEGLTADAAPAEPTTAARFDSTTGDPATAPTPGSSGSGQRGQRGQSATQGQPDKGTARTGARPPTQATQPTQAARPGTPMSSGSAEAVAQPAKSKPGSKSKDVRPEDVGFE